MQAESTVTIWHFDENEQPKRKVFKGVYINGVKRISKNGIKQKGFFEGTSYSIRIPTIKEIVVCPGDYISIGENFGDYPGTWDSFKILEVADNRRGGQPHWRILCGG